MRKRSILLFVFFLLSGWCFSQIPSGYYNNAYGKKGYALRVALFNIIDDHNVQSYDALWNAFRSTDCKPNGKVWDIYSDRPNATPPYEFTFGSDQCGNYNDEGDCYNREHSVPKSWFGNASPMLTDLFHLYPTDGFVNSKRSNLPLSEVNASWTSENGSKLGSSTWSGYSGSAFEPIDEYKGDLARTYFYMCVRYLDKNLGQENNSMYSGSSLKPWALSLLISWHNQDPVSDKEIDRNNAIYQIQHNRNPFIDYPFLVGKIFGPDSVNVFNPNAISDYPTTPRFSFYPNPATSEVFINAASGDIKKVVVLDILGNTLMINDGSSNTIQVNGLSAGVYFLQFFCKDYIETHKLIVQ